MTKIKLVLKGYSVTVVSSIIIGLKLLSVAEKHQSSKQRKHVRKQTSGDANDRKRTKTTKNK